MASAVNGKALVSIKECERALCALANLGLNSYNNAKMSNRPNVLFDKHYLNATILRDALPVADSAGASAYVRPPNTTIMNDSDEEEGAGGMPSASGKQNPTPNAKPAHVKSNTKVSGGKKQAEANALPKGATGAATNSTKTAPGAKVSKPKAAKASDKRAPLSMKSPMLNSRVKNVSSPMVDSGVQTFSSLRPVQRQAAIAATPDGTNVDPIDQGGSEDCSDVDSSDQGGSDDSVSDSSDVDPSDQGGSDDSDSDCNDVDPSDKGGSDKVGSDNSDDSEKYRRAQVDEPLVQHSACSKLLICCVTKDRGREVICTEQLVKGRTIVLDGVLWWIKSQESARNEAEYETEYQKLLAKHPGIQDRVSLDVTALQHSQSQHILQDKDRYHNVFEINGWPYKDGTVVAVKLGSFINHSCTPNLNVHFDLDKDTMTVQTDRDILAKEEVTVSYLSTEMLNASVEMRQLGLKKWGFYCTCAKCLADTLLLREASTLSSNSLEQREDARGKLSKLDRIAKSLNKKPLPSPEIYGCYSDNSDVPMLGEPLGTAQVQNVGTASSSDESSEASGSDDSDDIELDASTNCIPQRLPVRQYPFEKAAAEASQHVDALASTDTTPSPLPIQHMAPIPRFNPQGEPLYEIRCITRARTHNKNRELLVQWQGYGPADSTWESRARLLNDVPEMVKAFEEKKSRPQAAAAALTPPLLAPHSFHPAAQPYEIYTCNSDDSDLGSRACQIHNLGLAISSSESDDSDVEELDASTNRIPQHLPVRQHKSARGSASAVKTHNPSASNQRLVASPETSLYQKRHTATSVPSSHTGYRKSAVRQPRMILPITPDMVASSLAYHPHSKNNKDDAPQRYDEQQLQHSMVERELKRRKMGLEYQKMLMQ